MGRTADDFGRYVFAANDHPDGQSFITLEPAGKTLVVLGNGCIVLRLQLGVDIKQAEALAWQLNELVEGIEYVQ